MDYRGDQCLEMFVKLVSGPVLDIGSGTGFHANIMSDIGLEVITLDPVMPADIESSWPPVHPLPVKFGGIWACHVLEHSQNPGAFLSACFESIKPGGWLAVTVPPAKHSIVGGHVTLWNAGLLLYNLILAGFDCRYAKVKSYGYNISVIVQAPSAWKLLPEIVHDNGDIEKLAHLFPLPVEQGFDGQISELNWGIE